MTNEPIILGPKDITFGETKDGFWAIYLKKPIKGIIIGVTIHRKSMDCKPIDNQPKKDCKGGEG